MRARLFSGEGKKEGVSDKTALTVDSLSTFKDKKCQNPKLNHDLPEKSNICIPKLEIELSEDGQKELSE